MNLKCELGVELEAIKGVQRGAGAGEQAKRKKKGLKEELTVNAT